MTEEVEQLRRQLDHLRLWLELDGRRQELAQELEQARFEQEQQVRHWQQAETDRRQLAQIEQAQVARPEFDELLRTRVELAQLEGALADLGQRLAEVTREEQVSHQAQQTLDVITSYSIHYTKLYDAPTGEWAFRGNVPSPA